MITFSARDLLFSYSSLPEKNVYTEKKNFHSRIIIFKTETDIIISGIKK